MTHAQLSPNIRLSIEFLHLGTLIHDDVIDSHQDRWHLPTLNAEFGVGTAVLAGDICFGLAGELASHAAAELNVPIIPSLVANTGSTITRAQQNELDLSGSTVSKAQYEDISAAKTSIGQLAIQVAAALCPVSASEVNALLAFRRSLGVSSQIANDFSEMDGIRGYLEPLWVAQRGNTEVQQSRLTVFVVRELIAEAGGSRDALIELAVEWYWSLVADARSALSELSRPVPMLVNYLEGANPIWRLSR